MVSWFAIIYGFVLGQRLVELILARRNEIYIRSLGGYEAGAGHYPLFVLLHLCFLLLLPLEVYWRGRFWAPPSLAFLGLFFLAQCLRIWCIFSLGCFWNTRILILPGSRPVVTGPYRFLRHPNYLVVVVELLTLPLSFGAVCTAALFSALNLVLLRVRIRVEEEALCRATGYEEYLQGYNRFIPRLSLRRPAVYRNYRTAGNGSRDSDE